MTPLRQQGLSLIEVMIALAVFSFGLLALAALMASGLKYNTSALHRSYATSQAYDMAGITVADIDLAEVHDCFTIAEIVATEDLGFFAPGEGPRAVDEGRTALDGDHPINSSGGLKAKGHPVGASGVGQVIEIYHQLRGEAGERQVKKVNPTVGLTHNVGGTGGTCVVNVLRRES